MPDLIYPTSATLTTVAQTKIARLAQNRAGFTIMPMVNVDAATVQWEQLDNYVGLQNVRGINGEPTRVKKVGFKTYRMAPGIYGEFVRLDEKELTERRAIGDPLRPVNVTDLVGMAQDNLLQRRLDRIELIIWTLLLTGTFSVADPSGTIIHTDSFTLQSFAAGTPWSTVATATPLANLRTIQLLSRGYSVNFGAGARLYVNRTTANNLANNQNSADIYGRRTAGLASPNSLSDMNTIFMGEDLPQIVIYDETYIDDAGAVQLFIPNGQGVLVGVRPAGQTVGQYQMTRNTNNPNMRPGAYMKVIDRGETEVPRSIDVHDGHNGGPALFYPSALVKLSNL